MAEDTHKRWIRRLSEKLPRGVPVARKGNYLDRPWPVTFGTVENGQAIHDRDEEDPEGGDMPLQCLECKYYVPLEGRLGFDWGACTNPLSEYDGEAVFEHWTCANYTLPDGVPED